MSNDPFVGTFSLSGVKSTLLTLPSVNIPAWSSLILGDNLVMFASLSGFQSKTGLSLNFWDTNALNISLLLGTTLLDNFIVDTGTVISLDNQKTSFHKQFASGIPSLVSTISSLSFGVSAWFFAHPGRVYDANGWLLIPQISSGWTWITTGNASTGISLDCGSVLSGILRVDEIHDGSQYNDYIELLFLTDWIGGLEFSGNALLTSLSLPSQSWKANTRYLITTSSSWFSHSSNIIAISWLQVTNGLLIISDVNWNDLDYILVDKTGQSVYHTQDFVCVHNFATLASPSPWFDHQFLNYLNTQTVTQTQTITGACTASWTNNSTWMNNTGLSTSWVSIWLVFHDVRISLIDYDPPWSDTNTERIGLIISTGNGIPLSGFSLSYDGKLFAFSTWVLFSGIETIITGNYIFVNSRPVCISLYYQSTQLDTACYDPSQNPSPFLPLYTSTWSIVTSTSGDDQIDYNSLVFDITHVVYDPPWSDTNSETVTITFVSGANNIVLDNFRLRVGTANRRIYGILSSGQTTTLVGNFQMSNSNATCIALTYNEIVYDEYCYNPASSISSSSTASVFDISSAIYRDRLISILDINYDPEWNDTDRESITLLMTGNQDSVDLSKLYLRFGSTKRSLKWFLSSWFSWTVTGNFQMPNSKPTCVDLMEGTHIFDTYCYDPMLDKEDDTTLTGNVLSGKLLPDTVIDRWDYYSGLQLQRILPNPKDKDIKNLNEKFALYRKHGSGQKLTRNVKLIVGKTSINLSGYSFASSELIVASPKALTNQQACVRLVVDGKELDKFCYPQAKEWMIYYHPRLKKSSASIPLSVIDSLDKQKIDFSSLRLKKVGKQICLRYDDVSIRCMAAGSSTDPKTKALTTLSNAYIREMWSLIDDQNMNYALMDQWTESYRILAKAIKSWRSRITLYGYDLKSTDLSSYRQLVYERSPEDVVLDVLTTAMIL